MNNKLYAFMLGGKVSMYAQHLHDKTVNFYKLVLEENKFNLEPLFRMTPSGLSDDEFVLFSLDSPFDDLPLGKATYCDDDPQHIHFDIGNPKNAQFKSLVFDDEGCYDLLYDSITSLESFDLIEPTYLCSLIHPRLKSITFSFTDSIVEEGLFKYENDKISILLRSMYYKFEGYQEYFPVIDDNHRNATLCTKYTEDFIVQKIYDLKSRPYSMVINKTTIRLYKSDALFKGNQQVYQSIIEGKIDPEYIFRYTDRKAEGVESIL